LIAAVLLRPAVGQTIHRTFGDRSAAPDFAPLRGGAELNPGSLSEDQRKGFQNVVSNFPAESADVAGARVLQDGLGRSNSKLVIVPSSSPRGLSYSLLAAAGFPSMTYCYRPLEAGALDSSLRGQRFMVAVGVAERRDSRNPGLRGDARRRKGAPHTGRRCVARSRRPEQLVLSRSTNQRFSDQSEK